MRFRVQLGTKVSKFFFLSFAGRISNIYRYDKNLKSNQAKLRKFLIEKEGLSPSAVGFEKFRMYKPLSSVVML